MNKRDFLLAGSGALISAPGWSAGLAAAAAPATAGQQAWQQRLGERFVQSGAAPLALRRVDLHVGDRRCEQFTLVFAEVDAVGAPRGQAGTRLLRGADGRQLALYLDAAGSAADGRALWRADLSHLV